MKHIGVAAFDRQREIKECMDRYRALETSEDIYSTLGKGLAEVLYQMHKVTTADKSVIDIMYITNALKQILPPCQNFQK